MLHDPIPLLIIGAGPFGLALSAYARRHGIEHLVVGRPMEFWHANMPRGMLLRSACDWHYDPFDEETIERFLESKGMRPADVEPLSLDLYREYAEWFRLRKGITALPARVERLDAREVAAPLFEATLDDGRTVVARKVVLAVGFRYFAHVPEELAARLPPGGFAHTCDAVDLSPLRGRRVLILGGRQSAFEWAALLREEGAAAVTLSYRHATPAFQPSDWEWIGPVVAAIVTDPGGYRRLSPEEKEAVGRRLWAEGRLKLEPWLAARLDPEGVRLLPYTQVAGCREGQGEIEVRFSDGTTLAVDRILLATGYKVDVSRIPFLAKGNILPRLETRNGYPMLDERFKGTLPGLFFTSMCAVQDFGPYFAFTVAARASALVIGQALGAGGQ